MTDAQAFIKRGLDLVGAGIGLLLTGWLIALGWLAARASSGASGFFRQVRVGRHGRHFEIVKLRTMVPTAAADGPITLAGDPRVTRTGRLLRRLRIDELPQLWNVLRGDMSLVGPRPDVPGFADRLSGAERDILTVRPGITGPATLAFRNETDLLASAADPASYNRDVLFPAKVEINLRYVRNYSVPKDLAYITMTLFGMSIDPGPILSEIRRDEGTRPAR